MANLVPFDPLSEILSLQRQFFGDDFPGSRAPGRASIATTDVYTEDDKQLIIEAHLPYFDENDISVTNENGALVIQAEKHETEQDKKKKYVVRESSSSFYRRISLPEQANEDAIEAHMKDGVLRVTVPFKELPKPKRIAIKAPKK